MRGKWIGMIICVLVILLEMITIPTSKADETSDELETLVSQLPRGSLDIPIYWFEMESIIGWEKMMLVLGYADNQSICIHLKTIAIDETPARNFRCKPAN